MEECRRRNYTQREVHTHERVHREERKRGEGGLHTVECTHGGVYIKL